MCPFARVAQWIRAADYGSAGRGFESSHARFPPSSCYNPNMKQDKWGYPRKWPWWRDGMFWFITVGWGIMICPIVISFIDGWGVNPNLPLGLILMAPFLALPAFQYWYAFDSYRLETPHRWFFLFLPSLIKSGHDIHDSKSYLDFREEVIKGLRDRRDMPY